MLRPILAGWLLLGASSAYADSRTDGLCDYRIESDISVSAGQVVLDDGRERYNLADDGVTRNGRALTLDARQRALAREYRERMALLVPAVSDVALRGALLGLESIALVSAGLSGDTSVTTQAVARLEKLATQLHLQFDGRRLPAGSLALDQQFEDEIGRYAAESASGLAGSVFSFIGKALFDPQAAEARGDYLERLVERRIEPRAAQLEAQADQLCDALRQLDAVETRLDLFDVIVSERDEQTI